MESLKKIIQYLKNRLDSSTVFYRVLIFAVAAILGLFVDANIILDKELGHIDTPWRLIIGFCLAFATLFAIWLIEEDLAEQAFKFKRRDKYLCGAIGGLLSAADEPNVAGSLDGIVARHAAGSVDAVAEICDTADLMLSLKHLQAALG